VALKWELQEAYLKTDILFSMSDSNFFLNDNFLLNSKQAEVLYHEYVRPLPVIDYHTHLSPKDIATDKKFENITEIWLKGDHYKWRAMRAAGVDEKFITGESSDKEKFLCWAKTVPSTIGNPLFHWTHLELKNPFGVEAYLDPASAETLYARCNLLLQTDSFSVVSLLKNFNVQAVATTDDPCDELQFHRSIKSNSPGFSVTPTFRPDAYIQIGDIENFRKNIQRLGTAANIEIKDLDSFIDALRQRINFFHDHGCRVSDHGLRFIPVGISHSNLLNKSFRSLLQDNSDPVIDRDHFTAYVLRELCKIYHEKNWVQQFHLGALRNNNSRLQKLVGADCGCDSIGDYQHAEGLSSLLNYLDAGDRLAKTILYNLNPADNELFATMAGNFNDGKIRGKVQYGTAWWFLDQKDGIEKQLRVLSSMGLISTFIGMTTDSRSFLSYPRHEYFRRILCNLFGAAMQKGELPNDEKWIGKILQDICYHNAKDYFDFD
jgi:glucuronate isomerase